MMVNHFFLGNNTSNKTIVMNPIFKNFETASPFVKFGRVTQTKTVAAGILTESRSKSKESGWR